MGPRVVKRWEWRVAWGAGWADKLSKLSYRPLGWLGEWPCGVGRCGGVMADRAAFWGLSRSRMHLRKWIGSCFVSGVMTPPPDSAAPASTAVSVVAAERGSIWAPWVSRFRAATPGAVELLVQYADESAIAFADRVRRTVGALVAEGRAPTNAVFVGSGRGDAHARSVTPTTVRLLAASVAKAGGGRVYLDSPVSDRHRMSAIASTLKELLLGTGVEIEALAMQGGARTAG